MLRRLGATLVLLLALLATIFGLAQMPPVQRWLGQVIARAMSGPGFVVAIEGLGGLVPFRVSIDRIDIGDAAGTYLSLHDIAVRISPTRLLSGRVRIRSLTVGEIDMARLPALSKSSRPLADYLRVPRLPATVAIEELAIGRLALATPVLGDGVVAAIDGEARIAGNRARLSFDLHRIDGRKGSIALAMAIAGAPPILTLRLAASEPTGILIDRLLGRDDHLPLALSLDGVGPVADWHGSLNVAAGTAARIEAKVTIAAAAETGFGLAGMANVAQLLPKELAPLIGDRLKLELHGRLGRRFVLDRWSIQAAAIAMTGDAALGGPGDAVAAHLRASVPNLAVLSPLLGEKLGGSASFNAVLAGSATHPNLTADLSATRVRVSGSGAARVDVTLSATPKGAIDDPGTRIDVTANSRIQGLILPEAATLPPTLGRDLDFSAAGFLTRDGGTIDLARASAHGMGLDLTGAGKMAGAVVSGRIELSAADLRPFGLLLGHPVAGSVKLAVEATRRFPGGFRATLEGTARGLQTGIAPADALLGGAVTIKGAVERAADGMLTANRIEVESTAARLSGKMRFDPTSRNLGASLTLDVPRLRPLGAALGAELAGAATARFEVSGALDRLAVSGQLDGRGIAAAGVGVDHVRLVAKIPDLATPRVAIDGGFGARGLKGTLVLTALPEGGDIAVPQLRLTAAGGVVEGALRIARDTGLVRGRITGKVPDLGRWSALAGKRLGGSLKFAAGLDADSDQRLDLTTVGTGLFVGAGSSRLGIGHLDASIRLAGLRRTPSVSGRLALTQASLGTADLTAVKLTVESPKPGRFRFDGDAKGQPLTVAFAGDGSFAPGAAELRLSRLTGLLGRTRLALQRPLILSRRGGDLAFSGLDLTLGTGRLAGSAELRGEGLNLAIDATGLSIAAAAQTLGYRNIRGKLSASVRIGGSLRAPQGHLSLTARGLDLSAHASPAGLGLAVAGDWNGRNLAVKGRVTGLKGDSIAFDGSAPLLLRRAPLGISMPAAGRLALNLRGSGRLDHLADLLPLGEDRVAGLFSVDVSVAGTLAAPAASGHLRLTDARWENFATGAVLTNVEADLAGDRDRFQLTSFKAADTAGGTIEGRGSVVLNRPAGPVAELSATLAHFRIAARDEAALTASGRVAVTGPIGAPKISGHLTIDKGEINLPRSPPSSVARLDVIVVDSKTGKGPAPFAPPTERPMLPAALDLELDAPGPIFVRGHGLDSQWRGRLAIGGTSAAPDIKGRLDEIQGSFDLLGKTFQLTRGAIVFGGGAKLDPTLDIVAEASAADITARIVVTGVASAPKIALTSTPALPEDEILARVLFGQSVGRISAAQGLQLAQAAATLAGGGPGVLDRLRGKLGLDWLSLGKGSSGAASSILNPAVAGAAGTSGAALSAGKYLMPGVSVGVTQGVSPPTSKVTVQVEVRPHVTVQGEAGQSGNTGIGLNYQYDY